MPTPQGLPRKGEVWELDIRIPGRPRQPLRFVVVSRDSNADWALRIFTNEHGYQNLRAAYWLRMGWLRYIGEAGPGTRRRLHLD